MMSTAIDYLRGSTSARSLGIVMEYSHGSTSARSMALEHLQAYSSLTKTLRNDAPTSRIV